MQKSQLVFSRNVSIVGGEHLSQQFGIPCLGTYLWILLVHWKPDARRASISC